MNNSADSYNGWSNVATWLTVLHIDSDHILDRCKLPIYAANELRRVRCYRSVDEFKQKALKLIDIKSEFSHYGDFTKDINWQEIFNYYSYNPDFPNDNGLFIVSSPKELLKHFTTDKDKIILPEFEIDRDLYLECKTIIESCGYKYQSKKFTKPLADAKADLQKMISGVDITSARKQFDFFPTPEPLVKLAQSLLQHDNSSPILEPSAGTGNLVSGLENHAKAIEINPDCIETLKSKNIAIIGQDFELEKPQKFKYIIMNPPFSNRKDCKHTILAFNDWLEEGGTLVSITSGGVMQIKDKHSKAFQELYEEYGVYQEEIRSGSFKESGTNVSTMIHKFVKTKG